MDSLIQLLNQMEKYTNDSFSLFVGKRPHTTTLKLISQTISLVQCNCLRIFAADTLIYCFLSYCEMQVMHTHARSSDVSCFLIMFMKKMLSEFAFVFHKYFTYSPRWEKIVHKNLTYCTCVASVIIRIYPFSRTIYCMFFLKVQVVCLVDYSTS